MATDVDEFLSLMRQAGATFDANPRGALELGRRALDLAERLGVVEMIAWAEAGVGGSLYRLKEWRESLTHMYRSAELVPRSPEVAETWRLIAEVHENLHESERALTAYGKAVDAERATNNNEGLMWTEGLLASYLNELGRHADAVSHFERALKLATYGDAKTVAQLRQGLKLAQSRLQR